MSMYALLRSSEKAPTEEEVEDALGGNLCRCTGYRPILDAFRTFTKTDPKAYSEEAIAASSGLPYGSHEIKGDEGQIDGSVCPSTGLPCDCSKASNGSGCGTAGCGACSKTSDSEDLAGIDPIFPSELKKRLPSSLFLPGPQVDWYRPLSMEEVLDLKTRFPTAKLVVGNTEVGIEMKFKDMKYPVIIAPTHVPEMNKIQLTPQGLEVGAAVTLTKMMRHMKDLIEMRPAGETQVFKAVVGQLRWFAGTQIRNVSALGGNIVTGSPISDLNPIWMASGATFVAISKQGERAVPASSFFTGYRQVDLRPDEVLYKVIVPFSRPLEYVKEFKQSPRREDDIAIVNAGMRVQFIQTSEGQFVVEDASFAFGGVAAKAIMAPTISASLIGKLWNRELLETALEAVKKDVVISDTAPGGKVEYRRALAASFVFKFFVGASLALESDAPSFSPDFPLEYRSAGTAYERHPAHGVQFYSAVAPSEIVGQPQRHLAADLQVTGEATYTDDVRHTPDLLHAALVTSQKPHAKLLRVDPSGALALAGVAGYYGAKDVPGSNIIGPTKLDEEVFATQVVTCVGQVIGVVVAESEALARRAAKLVVVEYEDLPAILSCEDAIASEHFYDFSTGVQMVRGDVDPAFADCDHVIEGTFRAGGQEHFYLETNAACIVPQENDEFLLISSTQAPAKHQKYVSSVLGVYSHKIVSKAKRLGGGFGGKETRGIFLHCAIAVPSYHLKRPVRIMLDRDEDMQMTGHRHPFLMKYKVGFSKQGEIQVVDGKLYNNAGNSWDLSHAVMDRAILHSDGCYKLPKARFTGNMCLTHQSSNTAFRGFGGPQGLLFSELWLERMARTISKPVHDLRALNLQDESYETHYGQTMEACRIRTCWDQVLSTSSFNDRLESVKAFNSSNRWRKRGLAAMPTKFGISFTALFMNQAGALIHIYLDGAVLVTHGGVEMGQGLHTKMSQVAAQALGVPLEKVFICDTSTGALNFPVI